ncbi:hypothetical protein ACFLIM_45115 [Nonomuraea sp. M3C6]|uniref:Uncharacterized protein n=1 Tax=Nonomuraea marmarensis TaxID=3351344 RepID=A0ABW7ASG9_9ACTN
MKTVALVRCGVRDALGNDAAVAVWPLPSAIVFTSNPAAAQNPACWQGGVAPPRRRGSPHDASSGPERSRAEERYWR